MDEVVFFGVRLSCAITLSVVTFDSESRFPFSTLRFIQTLLVEEEEPHFYPYSANFTKLEVHSFIIQDEKNSLIW